MPKATVNLDDWAVKKQCGYCGKDFYPKTNEGFCGYMCEDNYKGWMEDMDWFYTQDWLKNEQ